MRSNRMQQTLDALHFRVTDPEESIPEALDGAVITALNEEAVACAALANKGGINLIVTYEAFGAKMHGALRQEIIFAHHANEAGRVQGWLSVPLVLTSHTWENGKNEQSHQDPSMAEAMLGETSQVSRVLFPADYNTAAVVLQGVYQTQGQVWTLVVPKADTIPELFTLQEAERLLADGALRLEWAGHKHEHARIVLTALGAYQLEEVLKASFRLGQLDIPHAVVYMLEPGRFRAPRNAGERTHAVLPALRTQLYPESIPARVFVTHTRPEPLLGVLQPLHTGSQTVALGFINQGGTLSTAGMLLVNHCTWAHVVAQVARLFGLAGEDLLSPEEWQALEGKRAPHGIIIDL
jgi:phosphoketolase